MRTHTLARWLISFALLGAFTQGVAHEDQAARMRAALALPERSAQNKARDANRKPVETVQFFGIKPGDTVIDMIAAGGWFTEVLSAAVGPAGHVYSRNPPFFPESDAEKARLKHLGNAESVQVQLSQAGIVAKADAVVTAMNLHDIHNGFGNQPAGVTAGGPDSRGRAPRLNALLRKKVQSVAPELMSPESEESNA